MRFIKDWKKNEKSETPNLISKVLNQTENILIWIPGQLTVQSAVVLRSGLILYFHSEQQLKVFSHIKPFFFFLLFQSKNQKIIKIKCQSKISFHHFFEQIFQLSFRFLFFFSQFVLFHKNFIFYCWESLKKWYCSQIIFFRALLL